MLNYKKADYASICFHEGDVDPKLFPMWENPDQEGKDSFIPRQGLIFIEL